MKRKQKPRKDCIVCNREIFRGNSRRKYQERRSLKSLTCSRECSRIYRRVQEYVRNRIKGSLK